MSEKYESISNSQVNEASREILGEYRLEPLSAFGSEEHLQRVFDSLRDDPNALVVTGSAIGGGTHLIKDYRTRLETFQSETAPDRVPRTTALHLAFRMGFGIVERSTVNHFIDQADRDSVTPEAYWDWRNKPQDARVAEMAAYLKAHDADLLAMNLLEPEREGTMSHFASGLSLAVPRVTGESPYSVDIKRDLEARGQMTEGTLAAIYLLREHQVGQEVKDTARLLETFETPPASDTPEAPPGYYLG